MDWAETYEHAVARFGETPGRQLEHELVKAFQHSPQTVLAAIEKIGDAYGAGRVRSPWGALRAEVARQAARANVVVSDNVDRDKRVRQAEQYLRAAGLYLASEDELLDDLFGERGRLRTWKDDDELRDRMLALWRELQPAAARVEAEALERAEQWKVAHQRVAPPIDWEAGRLRAYADSGSTMLVS